jgi:hypothetical protein
MDHRCDQQPSVSIYPITKLVAFSLLPPTRGWSCEVERSAPAENCRDISAGKVRPQFPFFSCLHKHHLIYLWFYSPCEPRQLFQFLNLYTVCRTLWTGITRPLPTHRKTQTQNKRIRTTMPWAGFETMNPLFEREKESSSLDLADIVISPPSIY